MNVDIEKTCHRLLNYGVIEFYALFMEQNNIRDNQFNNIIKNYQGFP